MAFAPGAFAALSLVLAATAGIAPSVWAQGGRAGASGNGAPPVQGQNPNGMHVYLWGGLKSHGEGAHDYPQFFADWSKVLTDHGAVVDGALHPPSAADLERTDVIVIYKGDAGFLSDDEKTILEAYVKRGGGLVSFHDSLCGPDPAYFATLVGGGKKHGEVNFSQGDLAYTIVDKANPILKDLSDMTIREESFYSITWAQNPGIHALVTTVIPGGDHKGEVVPQMWTFDHTLPGGQAARAFVWMQGHNYSNFAVPVIQNTLLRGIAWAGKRPVDELVSYTPPPGGRGGRGGSGRGGRGGSGGGGRAVQ